ncbi:MAG: glycosyltransferase 87 family protein [Microbacteriaceae bacterium]
MKNPGRSGAPWATTMGRIGRSPALLWSAFVLTHLWLGVLNLYAFGWPLGDVNSVYKYWAQLVSTTHYIVGIDGPWVYPIVAIVPMLIATAFGFALYSSTWLSLVMALDAIAFAFIIGWRPRSAWRREGSTAGDRGHLVGWWWLAFLTVLGPIALGRIDSITVPLAIVGLAYAASQPVLASAILAVATWIKVWPAAILVAMVIALRARRQIVVTAVVTSIVIIVIAEILGSGLNVFSFVTEQTGRGLQIETPVSEIWLWQAYGRTPGTFLYYDHALMTYQVAGNGVGVAIALMTPLMALAVVTISLLAIQAVRAGAQPGELLAPLSLALVTALIGFNKVGSPQFMTWLAVPIILGLSMSLAGRGRSFRFPAVIAVVVGGLTQSFYPYLYGNLLALQPDMLVLLTLRNLLIFVLLGWAVSALWRLSRVSSAVEQEDRVGAIS